MGVVKKKSKKEESTALEYIWNFFFFLVHIMRKEFLMGKVKREALKQVWVHNREKHFELRMVSHAKVSTSEQC